MKRDNLDLAHARLVWLLWEIAGTFVLGFVLGLLGYLYLYQPHMLAWFADSAIPAVACAAMPVLLVAAVVARVFQHVWEMKSR